MGDLGSVPGWGRSSREGHGNPLQYSCLENPMDRGAWRAAVYGVAKRWSWLNKHHRVPTGCQWRTAPHSHSPSSDNRRRPWRAWSLLVEKYLSEKATGDICLQKHDSCCTHLGVTVPSRDPPNHPLQPWKKEFRCIFLPWWCVTVFTPLGLRGWKREQYLVFIIFVCFLLLLIGGKEGKIIIPGKWQDPTKKKKKSLSFPERRKR